MLDYQFKLKKMKSFITVIFPIVAFSATAQHTFIIHIKI